MSGRIEAAEAGRAAPWTASAALAVGLSAVLAGLWLGPLPAMARTAFSPHMILHLGLVAVAAPLAAFAILAAPVVRRPADVPLSLAAGVTVVEMAVVWGWHTPALHEAAARSDAVFALQQGSFLAAAGTVWLVSFAGRSRASAAAGGLVMVSTFMHMGFVGLWFVLAPGLVYPPEICVGAFGLDGLEDQRLGGALMAVGGATPYLAGALGLFARLLVPDPSARNRP